MRRALVVVALVAIVAAACSDDRPPAGTADSSAPSSSAFASFPFSRASVSASTRSTSPAPDLQAAVDRVVARETVPFHVVAVDLTSGVTATLLPAGQVLSASLYKLFVAHELLRRIAAGSLRADAPAHDPRGRTVAQCIEAMIVVSDNDCGVAGLDLVGGAALDKTLHADGYVSTSLAAPQQTSAADVALFLRREHDDPHSQLYPLLVRQKVDDRISLGLPPGTPFAHKTGDRLHWAHDAGVLTTPRGDVLLVVLSGPWPLPCCDADHPGAAEHAAFGAIADVGRAVYGAAA